MKDKFNEIERFLEGILPDSKITTFMKIIKFPSTVSDFLFEIKIKRFLSEIDRITQGKKDKFMKKIKNKNDLKDLGFKLSKIIFFGTPPKKSNADVNPSKKNSVDSPG